MKVLRENNITAFDVDNTLVLWTLDGKTRMPLQYGSETVYLSKHESHVRFLKHCHERGDYIVVWSQNGYAWAEQVVKALNLEAYVDEVRSKCTRVVDDKDNLTDIVGVRIYLGDK